MSKENIYTVSQLVANEAYEFAKYTVEQRAIPHLIDGFKPVHRFFITSCLVNARTEFKKVAGIAGNVADFGFKHGENSAAEAGALMAAEWNNNICLVEGRGNFGSRKIPEPGAARYIFARLSPNFYKYIKDIELAEAHPDPEIDIPVNYAPIIPLVLINGVRGIATGFATNILPHCPDDVHALTLEYVRTGKVSREPYVKFPQFTGTAEYVDNSKVVATGLFERLTTTKIVITEIPPGVDHISYTKILNGLVDSNENVRDYSDKSSETGFCFEVTFKRGYLAKTDDAQIIRMFRLSRPFSQNLTVIGPDGTVRVYERPSQIIEDFVNWRLENILPKRIATGLEKDIKEKGFLLAWSWLIDAIRSKEIVLTEVDVKDKSWVPAEHRPFIEGLLSRPVRSIMKAGQDELSLKIKEVDTRLAHWNTTTLKDEFINDLK